MTDEDYSGWALCTEGDDMNGDGGREILLSRVGRILSGKEHMHEYHLVSLTGGGSSSLDGVSIATLVIPTKRNRWEAGGVGRADLDIDGDGYSDYLLGAGNSSSEVGSAGGIYLSLGPASGRVELGSEYLATSDNIDLGIGTLALIQADGSGAFVVGAQVSGVTDDSPQAMVFLSMGHFAGEDAVADAPGLWEATGDLVEGGTVTNTSNLGRDIDGDGIGDLFRTISTTPDSRSSRPSVFLGPFDADRYTDEADATFEEDSPDGTDEAALTCTSPSGGALLVLTRHGGGLDDTEYPFRHPVFAWEGAGTYAPGDARTTLLDVADATAFAVACGGDVDGDGAEELAMHYDGDALSTHGIRTFFAMVELPDSGTWQTPDIADYFVAHPTSDNASVSAPLLGADVNGDGTDDLVYASAYDAIEDDHEYDLWRSRILVYHGERPGL